MFGLREFIGDSIKEMSLPMKKGLKATLIWDALMSVVSVAISARSSTIARPRLSLDHKGANSAASSFSGSFRLASGWKAPGARMGQDCEEGLSIE